MSIRKAVTDGLFRISLRFEEAAQRVVDIFDSALQFCPVELASLIAEKLICAFQQYSTFISHFISQLVVKFI
jgi:hypothetical protein